MKKFEIGYIHGQERIKNIQTQKEEKSLVLQKRPCGKESTEVWITQKIGKQRGKCYWKDEEISRWKAYTNACFS